MSTSTTLACLQLRLRNHLLKCSSLMCLRKTDISLKTKEHSGSGHAKASPSGSVHKTPFTSGSFYFILLCEFALFPISGIRFRTSGKRRKSSLSLRYSLGPCVPPKTGHALHAPLSLCVMETPCETLSLFCTTSALQRFVRFYLSHFFLFLTRCWWWDGSAPSAQKKSTCEEKTVLKSP